MTDVSESSDDMSKEAALRKQLDHVAHKGIVLFIYLFTTNLGFRVWQTKLPSKSEPALTMNGRGRGSGSGSLRTSGSGRGRLV
jgi:hypothetical protein